MAADDVSFTGNEIARREALDSFADALDHADKFMPDDHWHRNRLLRPGIPVVDVDVGAADRGLFDPDEHVIVAHLRHRHFLQPETRFGFLLDQRLHRLLHAEENRRIRL